MKVRSVTNGGVAVVDDDLGGRLVASGLWDEVSEKAPRRRRSSPRVAQGEVDSKE